MKDPNQKLTFGHLNSGGTRLARALIEELKVGEQEAGEKLLRRGLNVVAVRFEPGNFDCK